MGPDVVYGSQELSIHLMAMRNVSSEQHGATNLRLIIPSVYVCLPMEASSPLKRK